MQGWLVVNHSLVSGKFIELSDWLLRSARKFGMDMQKKTNAETILAVEAGGSLRHGKPDFVLFWDKDTRLARRLELEGVRLFNSAKSVESCDDKSLTYLRLLASGIKMPKTIVAPLAFDEIDWGKRDFTDGAAKILGYPIVLKECFGSFGEQVYLAQNASDLALIMNGIGTKPMLLQEFVATSMGRDIRLHIVGSKVAASMYRYSDGKDFRTNISSGGKMKPYTPNGRQIEMALTACSTLGLDFAGVDILFGKNDEPVFCEINSNAHFKNIFNCTGVDVADYMMQHILDAMNQSRRQ